MTNAHWSQNFPLILCATGALALVAAGFRSNEPGAVNPGGLAGSAGTRAMTGSGGAAGAAAGGMSGAGSNSSAGAAGSSGAAGTSGAGGGPPSTEKFSFLVASMKSLLAMAKAKDPNANDGFGGDLSYGEVGA